MRRLYLVLAALIGVGTALAGAAGTGLATAQGTAVRLFVPLAPRNRAPDSPLPAASAWRWQSPLPQGNTLRSVSFATDAVGWAVGDAGTILVSADGGATWTPRASGTTADLYRVVAVSPTVAWASGAVGTVLRSDDGGATWRTLPIPSGADLRGLAAASASAAWVVGSGGTILSTADGGATWTLQPSGTHADLLAVAAAARDAVWAVGAGNAILRGALAGPSAGAPVATRVPGQIWTVQELLLEHPFTDSWTRRGTSSTFDGVQTNDLGQRNTFVLTVSVSGPSVAALRRQSSDGNDCDYTGSLAPDLRSAAGSYRCAGDAPGVTNGWAAVIG